MSASLFKMAVNQVADVIKLNRIARATASLDIKHERLYAEFGYKEDLSFYDYYRAYDRMPHAWAAVHSLLDKTWKDNPVIDCQGEAQKKTVNKLFKKLWAKIKDADRRQMVGSFAGLIIQYRDSKPWNEPVDKKSLSAQKSLGIIKLIPAWEGQLTAGSVDSDEMSETYGQVLEWIYQEGAVGDSKVARTLTIHHDRILILSEGSEDGNHLSGIPLLKAGFNNLINLQKIEGAAPESFYKNSARQLMYKPDKEISPQDMERAAKKITDNPNATIKDYINEMTSLLNKGFDSGITFSGDVSVLQGQVPDPKPTWEINAQAFSASVRVPMRVLFGTEQGKMAGEQDGEGFAQTNMQRRQWLTESVIDPLIEKFILAGVLENTEYLVEWSDLMEPSLSDKMNIISKMAESNSKLIPQGLDIVFDNDEMREIAGYDPLTAKQKGLPEDREPEGD